MSGDGQSRYIEGFLAGQAVAYCERVNTGMSLAAQLVCPDSYKDVLCQLIATEGCKVLDDSKYPGQASLWIYRDELAARLVVELQSAHSPSELGIWSMGRLLGYANCDVSAFVGSARSAFPGEPSPLPSSDS